MQYVVDKVKVLLVPGQVEAVGMFQGQVGGLGIMIAQQSLNGIAGSEKSHEECNKRHT